MSRLCLRISLLIAMSALLNGCSPEDPPLGKISGSVTLDGQPLANAYLKFEPVDGQRPSVGQTDSSGFYRLKFTAERSGAVLGTHSVKIDAAPPEGIPKSGRPYYLAFQPGTQEITAKGTTIDFNLKRDQGLKMEAPK